MNKLDLEEATTWLELAATVTRLPATGLLARLRDGDENLSDAVHAIIAAERSPTDRLNAVRDFLVVHSLGETWDPATDVQQTLWRPETSPFQVPQRFLSPWFPPSLGHDAPPVEMLMRIRQYYDMVELRRDMPTSWRLFGNSNIGDARRTNLQVAGQLTFDNTPTLITSWWITTTTWPFMDEFFARTWLTFQVGERSETMTLGLELLRRRQTVLIPIPARENFSVRIDSSGIPDEVRPAHDPPLYVFIEGWGCRKQL